MKELIRKVLKEELEDREQKSISKSISLPKKTGVLLHELVTVGVFDVIDKKDIKLQPYHLIFGDSSLSIFDAFGTNEIAGLTREGAEEHITKMESEGRTEMDDAYIGGLTNFYRDQLFEFINMQRASSPGYINRILAHESLHLTRYLITLSENEWMRNNLKTDNWWEDERAVMVDLINDNEEYFAEVLERTTAIAYEGWNKTLFMKKG
jgi:hypothetical protein